MGQIEGDFKKEGLKCSNIQSHPSVRCCHTKRQKVTVFNGLPVLGWASWVVQSTYHFGQQRSHAHLSMVQNLMQILMNPYSTLSISTDNSAWTPRVFISVYFLSWRIKSKRFTSNPFNQISRHWRYSVHFKILLEWITTFCHWLLLS